MWKSDKWQDYELLDTSDGERLERWGKYILVRPDPQVIWRGVKQSSGWKHADAVYHRSDKGGGGWEKRVLPDEWTVGYGALRFKVRPTSFKHTGLFPEQAVNWDFIGDKIRSAARPADNPVRLLNLFAYTGGATVAAAAAGAAVCHVDASKGMVAQARENAALSGLDKAPVRYIVDDCRKFVEREIRRGNRYDAVVMDPPSYGRGPSGELWKLEDSIGDFISLICGVLSEKPLFVIINSYTTGLSPSVMSYLTGLTIVKKFGGRVTADELGLPVTQSGMSLPCGSAARWES